MRTNPSRKLEKLSRIIAIHAIVLLLLLQLNNTARAVIVIGGQGRNLVRPTGYLETSGWQYEGDWHGFTGTAIDPYHFLTAAHVGGFPGRPFIYRGETYRALDDTVINGTDLCVWRVDRPMPAWAPLYTGRSEGTHFVVLYGRGGSRGDAVTVDGALRGWYWGADDHRLSWGVSRIIGHAPAFGTLGDVLLSPFDSRLGMTAACVSPGDSGGGVFLQDIDGVWKLAGVISALSSIRCSNPRNPSELNVIGASLYDTRNLYWENADRTFTVMPANDANAYPQVSILCRVSASASGIRAALSAPAGIGPIASCLLRHGSIYLDRHSRTKHVLRVLAFSAVTGLLAIIATAFSLPGKSAAACPRNSLKTVRWMPARRGLAGRRADLCVRDMSWPFRARAVCRRSRM